MKKLNILILAGMAFMALALASCGGGGDGGDGDGDGGTTTDTFPPTVSSTVPASDGTGVAINSGISATFSEAMDPATITGSTFTLDIATGRGVDSLAERSVTGSVAYSASSLTATFTPSANLSYGTWYRATITTGVTDTAGNALAQNYGWDFQTGQAVDSTAPTVISTYPADGDTMVKIDTEISAEFSEDMATATVNADSFSLEDAGLIVEGSVSYADRTATFAPDGMFETGTEYTASVSSGATDLAGNPAVSESWSFTTSHWNLEDRIEGTSSPSGLCSVAADGFGGAIAAWIELTHEYFVDADDYEDYETDMTYYTGKVCASRYTSGGWGDPVVVSLSDDAAEVRVAMDSDGNAVVIWSQVLKREGDIEDYWGHFEEIWAKRYVTEYAFVNPPETRGWGDAVMLTGGSNLRVKEPVVAMHPDGNVMMAWREEADEVAMEIYCARFEAGETWPVGILELEEAISNEQGTGWGYAFRPDLTFDPGGNVLAVWYQDKYLSPPDGDPTQAVCAYYYNWSGNGEEPHEISDTGVGASVNQPRCGSDKDGNFAVVWTQDNVDDGNERENVYVAGYVEGEWNAPKKLSNLTGDWDAEQPRIAAVPGSNDAFAVWYEYPADHSEMHCKARRYSAAADWLPRVDLFPDWDMSSDPEIVIDEDEIVTVIAGGYTGTLQEPILHIIATQYVPGDGWGDTEVLTVGEYDYSPFSRWSLAIDGNGDMHAVCSFAVGDDTRIYDLRYKK